MRQSIDEAAESFKRGREALDANQPDVALAELTRAATLNPHEFEYTAILSFAQFLCATPAERAKTADKVRKMLGHAIQKSNDPESARFYLARMERLLDKKKEAVALLNQVLKAIPGHPGATAELQDIEDKAAEKAGLGGLFSRKKDK